MDISLTPEQEQLVRRQVGTGRYKSASEVVGEALRLMDMREQFIEPQGDVAGMIAAGVVSLREGRTIDGEAVFDRLEAELDAEERLAGA